MATREMSACERSLIREAEVDFDFEEDKGVFWATIADLFGTFDLAREGTKIK